GRTAGRGGEWESGRPDELSIDSCQLTIVNSESGSLTLPFSHSILHGASASRPDGAHNPVEQLLLAGGTLLVDGDEGAVGGGAGAFRGGGGIEGDGLPEA